MNVVFAGPTGDKGAPGPAGPAGAQGNTQDSTFRFKSVHHWWLPGEPT